MERDEDDDDKRERETGVCVWGEGGGGDGDGTVDEEKGVVLNVVTCIWWSPILMPASDNVCHRLGLHADYQSFIPLKTQHYVD